MTIDRYPVHGYIGSRKSPYAKPEKESVMTQEAHIAAPEEAAALIELYFEKDF